MKARVSLVAPLLALVSATSAEAAVVITPASGGGAISADTAVNGKSPAWTTLGPITIAEGKKQDFGNKVRDGTLVLKVPAGFEFNTASTPSISFTSGADVTSASVAITDPSTLTITYSTSGQKHMDTLTIGATGLQVRPTLAGPVAAGNHIYCPSSGGGSASINGISTSADGSDGSDFGALTEVAAAYAQLQLLLPGETAAPGTTTGKTGTPSAETAGSGFNLTVNAADAYWNDATPVTNIVALSTTDTNGAVPFPTGLVAGTKTLPVTLKTAGTWTLTATDLSDSTKAPVTSTPVVVNPGPASTLAMAVQPSPSVVAGGVLAQQPVVLIEDSFNNVRSNDSLTVTATASSGPGTLLGTTSVRAANGVAAFIDLAPAAALNVTLRFTSGALTPAISSNILVSTGPFNRLLVMLPGETNAQGTATGRSGTAVATAGSNILVRVIATDAYFNPSGTITDTVAVATTDPSAVPPPNAALVNGSNAFNLTFNMAAMQKVTATDVSDPTKTPNTDPVVVGAGPFVKLQLLLPGETAAPATTTGKTGTPTATVSGTSFSVIVNGVDANWNVAPTANAAGYTIRITSSDTNAILPANADLASGTRTFNVALKTAGSWTVTAADIDDSTKTPSTSPPVTVNPTPFTKLQVLLPGETAVPGSTTGKTGTPLAQTAGTAFSVSVKSVDANWNPLVTNDLVHLTASDTNAVLPAEAALSNGVASLTLTLKAAGARTVTASDVTHPAILANTSSLFTLNPAAYTGLQVLMPGEAAAPGTASGKTGTPNTFVAGTPINTLKVSAVDFLWNVVPTNVTVAITSSDTNAVLPANSALGPGGSKANFSLTFKTAGLQVVSARDIANAARTNTSSVALVIPGGFTKLQVLTPGERPMPGTASGKTGLPLVQTSNVPFAVTVNSVDANWNLLTSSDTVRITSSDPSAILPPNAALVAGSRDFNVALVTAGTGLTVTASDVTHPATAAATSSPLTIVGGPSLPSGRPVVAIHDSELTRALETMPAASTTPTGPGTTGFEWWPTNWHYFVMPESLKEAMRSDGTAFEVVSDADIAAGKLLDVNGRPRYPIVLSLASEAIADSEIAPLTNYVAAGGFLFVGSSAFTRNTNGTTRGDFAFANQMGIHSLTPSLGNWRFNSLFTKQTEHRLASHIPSGQSLYWEMPSSGDEIPWGIYPHPGNPLPANSIWQVQSSNATLIISGDVSPCLLDRTYGSGHFIYDAALQPLIGHGGWAPGMYAYLIVRKAVEWAFESSRMPIPKLSPWPYPYNAAFMVRHDLENFQNEIAGIEASAQVEFTNGAKGEYYFCTGTLREEMSPAYDTNAVVASLRRAVSNYNSVINSHNGGLRNPYNNPPLVLTNYDYWHWGPDEALNATITNYPTGKAYALTSVSNSFHDIEGWLPGLANPNMRVWVAPYFDATREDSYDIENQLGVKATGEQKLTTFPSWVLSTATSGKRYPFVSLPVSDWYVGNTIAQSLEAGHSSASVHALVDFYYGLGALINLYSHTLSTGLGTAGSLEPDYVTYGGNTNLHPRLWAANAIDLYNWWLQRSNAQVAVSYSTTSGENAITTFNISGATDPNTALELLIPGAASLSTLQVLANGLPAAPAAYRTNGQVVKILVGTTVTNAQVRYLFPPQAQNDAYTLADGPVLNVPAPGVLANDSAGAAGTSLTAILLTSPTNGTLTFNANGGFTYIPVQNFGGFDAFTYQVSDGVTSSAPALVTLTGVTPPNFSDNFQRSTDPGPVAPWIIQDGNWTVTGGQLQGGPDTLQTYGNIYLNNNWVDYVVTAQLSFPAGAFGGGLGGRLNPATGQHYTAWIYPEGSSGGSKILSLLKFQNWTTWSPLQQVNLAAVGTNWHTVRLAFKGSQIAVAFDGTQLLNFNDAVPYPSGGVSVDMWTDLSAYILSLDSVTVSPLVAGESYSTPENSVLNVPAPGVLTNDIGLSGSGLSAAALTSPAHGALTLNANGSFTYAPAANYSGPDAFIYQANDGANPLGNAWVNLSVTPIINASSIPTSTNSPPLIQSVALSGGRVVLTWRTISGRNYRLEYKSSLTSTNWTALPPVVTATGSSASATDALTTASQRFYRVVLLP